MFICENMTYRDPLFATARNETKTFSSHGQDNMSVQRWIFYTHTDVCISCLKGMLMSCSFRFFVLLAHHPSDDAVLSSCCGDLEMSHLSMRSVNTVFPCVPWFGKEVWISFNLNKILCEILFFAFFSQLIRGEKFWWKSAGLWFRSPRSLMMASLCPG